MTEDPTASFALSRVSAGVLFFDERDRVMLIVPSYKDYRDVPGGYVEWGESPLDGAVREVREELGITPPIGRLLVTDWAPSPGERDKLLFLFDGGVLAHEYLDRIVLDPAEIIRYEFHDVAAIYESTIDRLARRITQAVAARDGGDARYLEHGRSLPVSP